MSGFGELTNDSFTEVKNESKRRFVVESEFKQGGRKVTIYGLASDLPSSQYQHDKEATHCGICKKEFSFFFRRHHCRSCGLIFCDSCCSESLRQSGSSKSVRVCTDCLEAVKERNEQALREESLFTATNSVATSVAGSGSQQKGGGGGGGKRSQQQRPEVSPGVSSSTINKSGGGEEDGDDKTNNGNSADDNNNANINPESATTNAYDFTVKDSKKNDYPLSQRRGLPTLVMNVASQCAFTQKGYTAAVELYEKYKDRGFTVLAFPCNQFSSQEPGSEEEIVEFACTRFKAGFPIMAKCEVNGDKALPLYKHLKFAKKGFLGSSFIKWNFTSFLVDGIGKVIERFAPGATVAEIEKVLVPLLPSRQMAATLLEEVEREKRMKELEEQRRSSAASSAAQDKNSSKFLNSNAAISSSSSSAAMSSKKEKSPPPQKPPRRITTIKTVDDLNERLANPGNEGKFTLVKGFAAWCKPCQINAPKYEDLSQLYHHQVQFLEFDVDDADHLAQTFRVEAMPQFIFFQGLVERDRFQGPNDKKLEQMIKRHILGSATTPRGSGTGGGAPSLVTNNASLTLTNTTGSFAGSGSTSTGGAAAASPSSAAVVENNNSDAASEQQQQSLSVSNSITTDPLMSSTAASSNQQSPVVGPPPVVAGGVVDDDGQQRTGSKRNSLVVVESGSASAIAADENQQHPTEQQQKTQNDVASLGGTNNNNNNNNGTQHHDDPQQNGEALKQHVGEESLLLQQHQQPAVVTTPDEEEEQQQQQQEDNGNDDQETTQQEQQQEQQEDQQEDQPILVFPLRNEEDFDIAVNVNDQVTVCKAYAEWCSPCQSFAQDFLDLSKKYGSNQQRTIFVEFDVDDLADVADRFGIEKMPVFLLFRGGKELARLQTVKKDELDVLIKKHI